MQSPRTPVQVGDHVQLLDDEEHVLELRICDQFIKNDEI